MSGSHLSADFYALVKSIGESKSKQEEDRIIQTEVQQLKKKLPDASVSRKKMKEFIVRLVYVEMLGHDASFGYIKAIEMTASQNIVHKKVGYLCSALCLSPEHEFRFMLVNQLQRDLGSANHLEACAALTALSKLVTVDMIPAMIGLVAKLLAHDKELVRKKAVMVLQRLNQVEPGCVDHLKDNMRRALCDKDPSVMGAALCVLYDMSKANPQTFKDLVPSFVSILKQITEHRLPREYDYHRMPAPWIQLRLLQILGLLGHADQAASEGMYEVLRDVMRRADTGINVGYAIIYECVRTVTSIYPNAALLDAAAASISRFISSDNHNLKYIGVTGLALIVRDHPKYAANHQIAVIECLEDRDETLKRKTLGLLYSMTNPVNVEFITAKLLSFLEAAGDLFWRSDLVKRITQCAERFAPSNSWYVGVMTRVFLLAGDIVKPEVAPNLLALIAEGSGEDDEADEQLRRDAAATCIELLDKSNLPYSLVQIIAWVVGEYGYLVSDNGGEQLPEIAQEVACMTRERSFKKPGARPSLITALLKLAAQSGSMLSEVNDLINHYATSSEPDLQQRCLEFIALTKKGDLMGRVLPVDASCEDLELDPNLAFLDSFVARAVSSGAAEYCPPTDLDEDRRTSQISMQQSSGFKITPYAKPTLPVPGVMLASEPMSMVEGGDGASSGPYGHQQPDPAAALKAKVGAKIWGRPSSSTAEQAPAPSKYGSASSAPPPPPPGAGSSSQPATQVPVSSAKIEPEMRVKTEAELHKERMAAALFGGMVASEEESKGLTTGISRGRATRKSAASASPLAPAATETEVNVSRAVTSAASGPSLDLLDMTFDASGPPPASAASVATSALQSSVQGDLLLVGMMGNQSSAPADDLLMSLAAPLAASAAPFAFEGHGLLPLKIATSEFGSRWMGSAQQEKKLQNVPTSAKSPDMIMTTLSKMGLYSVEAISATSEGICAATCGALAVLVHLKLVPEVGKVDLTIRSANGALAGAVAAHLRSASF